jgi:hypothetical protein
MNHRILVAVLGLVCLIPARAYAGAPQWPQAHPHAAATPHRSAIRQAPKPPRRDQVHRGGVDGAIALVQFISNRRQHDEKHRNHTEPHGSSAQVRASSADAERGTPLILMARAVESLPPHWGSTHLCI